MATAVTYTIENFRSIRKMDFEIRPLTILYGPNGVGKSSLMYAPLFLKHVLMTPAQPFDQIFTMPLFSLGSFDQVVFRHTRGEKIVVSVKVKDGAGESKYGLSVEPTECFFFLEMDDINTRLKFSFPNALTQNVAIGPKGSEDAISWNGLTATLQMPSLIPDAQGSPEELVKRINGLYSFAKNADIVPLRRGFFKPIYTATGKVPNPTSEDEVASLTHTDLGYSIGQISHYVENIFGKKFKVYSPPNVNSFYLRIEDHANKGFGTELVNEGYGLNQTVFMLIKILQADTSVVFIEEPEVHLHPAAQKKLMEAFVELVNEENKTICISTHSDILVNSLLTQIAEKKISRDMVRLYLVNRSNLETSLMPQEIRDDGVVEGGLAAFMEESLSDFRKSVEHKNG